MLACGVLVLADSVAAEKKDETPLILEGMTYVSSEGGESRLYLKAVSAEVFPRSDYAYLTDVEVEMTSPEDPTKKLFLKCEYARVSLRNGDFEAHRNIDALTPDGRRIQTDYARYESKQSRVTTDLRTVIHDGTGTFIGREGFRYDVDTGKLDLLDVVVEFD